MPRENNTPSILETNILFLLIALLLITLGARAQYKEIYTGLLVTEYLIILLPILAYLRHNDYSIKDALRLNKTNLKQVLLTIFIVIFSYPVAVFFNFIGLALLSKFSPIRANPIPIPSNPREYLIGFLIIALTPGICEEIMFRGFIMSSYSRFGKKKAIIYSAILFGIFHFNVQNLLGPIYLGLLFGIIAYKTDSIYPTIIGHTVNNTIALTIGYFATRAEQVMELAGEPMILPEVDEMIMAFFGLGLLALIFGFISFKLIKLMPSKGESRVLEINTFIQGESLIEDLHYKEGMSIIEAFPIFLVMIIFIIWNYIF